MSLLAKLLWGNLNSHEFTGGIRYGKDYYDAINASWPFAKLAIARENIALSIFWKSFSISRNQLKRIVKYSGAFSQGIRIEHTMKECPPFIVFWTRDVEEVTSKLSENGFILNEEISN